LIPYETSSWFKKHELVNICLKDNILKVTVSEIGTGSNFVGHKIIVRRLFSLQSKLIILDKGILNKRKLKPMTVLFVMYDSEAIV